MNLHIQKKAYIWLVVVISCILFAVIYFVHKFSANKKTNPVNFSQNDEILPPFDIPSIPPLDIPSKECKITDYGAKSDENSMNTESISDAISDCFAAGGGKVIVPEGIWKSGPIHLKSNIDFYLEKDARIVFSTNPDDYLPVVLTRFEGIELYNYSPLIYTKDSENVSISGEGILDGQGEAWSDWNDLQEKAVIKLYKMGDNNAPLESRVFGTTKDALRPSFVQFINCKNIHVSGITALNGPMWTLHFLYSENIDVSNVNVKTFSHNTDGIVIDSSKNAIIEKSTLETGDDAIAIKSGLDRDGWRVNRPSENIVIRNCVVSAGHSGISIGSEMSGGVRNVFASNCKFSNTDNGVRLKSLEGRGGIIENSWFQNIEINNANQDALLIDMSYPAYTIPSKTHAIPIIKNIHFESITGNKIENAVGLYGIPEQAVQNINLKNISIGSKRGFLVDNGEYIYLDNVALNTKYAPTYSLENSKDVFIVNPSCSSDKSKICLSIKGVNSDKIKLKSNDLNPTNGNIEFLDGANSNILTIEK
jgi:polygalacturonase